MNASQTELGIERGDQVVGVGTVMWDFLPDMPQSDGVVVTEAANVGPVSNPPAALDQTRVEGTAVGLTVYQNGEQIARGNAGQEQYRQQGGMEVRDVLVDRGLTHDTYVIAAVDDGTVSLTVKQIPLMTVMRLSVGALLLGMLLVLVFDPRSRARPTLAAGHAPANHRRNYIRLTYEKETVLGFVVLVSFLIVPATATAASVSGTVTVADGSADGETVTIAPLDPSNELVGNATETTVEDGSFTYESVGAPSPTSSNSNTRARHTTRSSTRVSNPRSS